MVLSSGPSPVANHSREAFPTFDLTFRYDDVADPAELTVFPSGEVDDRTTKWLTVDLDHAVPLESVR